MHRAISRQIFPPLQVLMAREYGFTGLFLCAAPFVWLSGGSSLAISVDGSL